MRQRNVFLLLFFFCAWFFALSFPARSAPNEELSVILDPWPPYSMGETGGPPTGGLLMDVAKELFKRVGIPYRITLFPWKRCLVYMEYGDADLLLGVTKTAEREKFMVYTIPLFVDRVVLFYSKERFPDGFAWNAFEDLQKYLIGVTAGYNMGEAFVQASKTLSFDIDTAEGETLNFTKLYYGRNDLFACYEISGRFWINENPHLKERIRMAEKPVLDALPFYLALSKKSKAVDLAPKINEAILSMTTDGTMDRLLGRDNE